MRIAPLERNILARQGKSCQKEKCMPKQISPEELDTAAAIVDPFEQSFFVMVHLPYLQPFEDRSSAEQRKKIAMFCWNFQ